VESLGTQRGRVGLSGFRMNESWVEKIVRSGVTAESGWALFSGDGTGRELGGVGATPRRQGGAIVVGQFLSVSGVIRPSDREPLYEKPTYRAQSLGSAAGPTSTVGALHALVDCFRMPRHPGPMLFDGVSSTGHGSGRRLA